jgi:ligand-binding sensor protein
LNPQFISSIIDLKKWQKIQDLFADVMGITIRMVDAHGVLLTKPSKPVRICELILMNNKKKCLDCLKNHIEHFLDRQTEELVCAAGFPNFVIPIIIEDSEIIGFLVVGPVLLGMRGSEEHYKETAQFLRLELDDFMDALREVKIVSYQTIGSIIALLKDAITYMVKLGYHKCRLENWLPGFLKYSDESCKAYANLYLNKLLNTLLDVALEITCGESGSVLLCDKNKNELFVKITRGISERNILQKRLRSDSSIAGIIAERAHGCIIDSVCDDNQIQQWLQRPEITSSMVIPIKNADIVFGVFTVNSFQRRKHFTKRHLELLTQLGELAAVAITTFKMGDFVIEKKEVMS